MHVHIAPIAPAVLSMVPHASSMSTTAAHRRHSTCTPCNRAYRLRCSSRAEDGLLSTAPRPTSADGQGYVERTDGVSTSDGALLSGRSRLACGVLFHIVRSASGRAFRSRSEMAETCVCGLLVTVRQPHGSQTAQLPSAGSDADAWDQSHARPTDPSTLSFAQRVCLSVRPLWDTRWRHGGTFVLIHVSLDAPSNVIQ
jgi:hypothetical protein